MLYILLKVSKSLINLSTSDSDKVPSSLIKSHSLSKSQKVSIILTKSHFPESLKSLRKSQKVSSLMRLSISRLSSQRQVFKLERDKWIYNDNPASVGCEDKNVIDSQRLTR